MIGVFVPMNDRKTSPGWIIDGDGCHVWVGERNRAGYGLTQTAGEAIGRRRRLAHLVRYEREVGPVPEGLVLDHYVCDNRACCNPRHVRPVTQRENTLRGCGWAGQNLAKTHCKHGHSLLDPNNLRPGPLKRDGRRQCMECSRVRGRARNG